MRVDVSFILQSMGFVPNVDFRAVQTTTSNVNVTWLSQTTMPTSTAIDTAAATATANVKAAADALQPDLAALRDNAAGAVSANVTYLAIGTPTNAQVAAQVRALTQQNQQIIKALAVLGLKALS